jgi:hypothetical protein
VACAERQNVPLASLYYLLVCDKIGVFAAACANGMIEVISIFGIVLKFPLGPVRS